MDPLKHAQTTAIELPNDIKTPELINQFPIAIGWWLLLLIIIAVLLITVTYIKKYKEKNRIKKQAIQAISVTTTPMTQTLTTLKWAAMAYFPRQELASLSGQKLIDYLTNKLPINEQERFKTQTTAIIDGLYKPNSHEIVNKELNQAALLWLQKALPPKTQFNNNAESVTNTVTQSLPANGEKL